MNPSGPSREAEPPDSSLAFIKPMPKRDDAAPPPSNSSVEVPPLESVPLSATDLWSQLQPVASDDPQRRTRIAGCQLGHFRVEEQIGRGGMGAVFRAVDLRLDRVVALKVLSPQQSKDPSSVERFRNEARAAARMDHDNIARVYYVGEDRGLSFIAFEFVHGATVRELIEQRRVLNPADAVNYTLQIAAALRHTDAAGVVHRDIKPSNIIITPGGRAKLVDLGLARKRDVQSGSDLTVDGTTLGTFDYISPEQAKDPRNVDVRSDIYSLGCTLYHMLTGGPPYPSGTMLQKLLDHQGKDVPDAAAANPRVPPELSAIVRKMMASDPRDRYATPDELIDDLSLIAHRFGLRPRPADGVPWTKPPARSGWDLWRQYGGWIATAAFLLIVVFVIDRAPRAPSVELALRDLPPQHVSRAANGKPADTVVVSSAGENGSPPPRSSTASDARSFDPERPLTSTPLGPLVGSDPGGVAGERKTPAIGVLPPVDEIFNSSSTSPGPIPQPIIPPLTPPPIPGAESPGGLPITDSLPPNPKPNGVSLPAPPAETSPKANPFVVFVNNVQFNAYPTLEAAVAGAPDNALIELQFDGDQQPLQPPLSIREKHLRIRAAKDYRPLLRFAVPQERRVPGREEQVSMLSLSGGSLGIYNVDLQLAVDPNLNIGQWVFLSLSNVEHLELHGVSMTLENNSPRAAALIELSERLRTAFLDETVPAVRIEAEDCFFRGEGDLLVSRNVDPARIQLRNVAVALDGALVRIEGTDAYLGSADMTSGHDIELELNHVTAILEEGVATFDVQRNFTVPRLVIDAGDSVISSAAPLVTMQGDLGLLDFQDRLAWSDDATYLRGDDVLWRITASDVFQEFNRDQFDAKWLRSRRLQPFDTATRLVSPRPEQPYSRMSRVDLQLSSAPDNPAREGASDRTDAGVDWNEQRLPRLEPSLPAPEKTSVIP